MFNKVVGSKAGRRSAWSKRFSSTSSRTTSARTNLQSRAAHRDRAALSRPQGETMPPVRTFESRNSRIRRRQLTSPFARELAGVGLSLSERTSCNGGQRRAGALRGVLPKWSWAQDRHARGRNLSACRDAQSAAAVAKEPSRLPNARQQRAHPYSSQGLYGTVLGQ
jgi:hypothetical protein